VAGVRGVARAGLAAVFVGAGVLHFVRPEPFVRIVPPGLPAPEALVFWSGVVEVAGGVGLLVPRARRAAGLGLAALLVAVFPANVHMALAPETAGQGIPAWALWARLPLQPALIGAVLWASGGRQRRGKRRR